MKKTIIVLLALCLTLFAFAEEKLYRHGIALDLGGPSTITQLEYQFDFLAKEKHHLGVSAGIGLFFGGNAIPLGIQYRWGKKFQLETGIHYTFLWSAVSTASNISLRLGCRLIMKRFFIHLYAAPMLDDMFGLGQMWGGLGFGFYL